MSEEQYESFKKLVKYKKVKNINKVATESKTMYEFVMEPNKDNISNKYKFDVSNVDRQMIEKLDRLIVEQRILKKNNKIKRIKVTATALVLAVVLPKASLTIYKNDKYNESVMEEVQTKIEQIYENHPNAEINDEIRKNIYNDVISQRNENKEIKRRKSKSN